MDITPVNAWPTAFPVIDDGDKCNNAEHKATAQAHADAATFLRGGVPGKATSYVLLAPLNTLMNTSNRWSWLSSSGVYEQFDTASQGELSFHLPVPAFGKLTEVHAVLDSLVSHSNLPATLPDLRVFKSSYTLGSGGIISAQIGSTATDAPGGVAAYEVPHELQVLSLNETLSTTANYYARIRGEAGANAINSALQLLRVYCIVTN